MRPFSKVETRRNLLDSPSILIIKIICHLMRFCSGNRNRSWLLFSPSPHFVRRLKSLSLHLHKKCNMDKLLLPALIFQANCTLEALTIYSGGTPMSIELAHIVPCLPLKRVTLSLLAHRHLFILCEHLRVVVSDYDGKDHSFNFDQYVLEKSFSKRLRLVSVQQ